MSGGGPPTSRYAYEEELNLGISPPSRDPFDVAPSDDSDESYDSDEYNIANGDNNINNNIDYEYGEGNDNRHHRHSNKKKKKKKKKSGRASRTELWKDDTRQFNKNGQNFEMVPLSSDSNHDNDNENNEEDYFTYDSDNETEDDDDDINGHHHHQGVRPSHYSNFYSLSTTDSSSSSSSSLQRYGEQDDYETSNSYLPKRLYRYLYPPNIPREVQLLRLENVAVPACYLLVGLLQGLSGPFTNVYPLDLNASEAQQTTISSLKSLPSTCKFIKRIPIDLYIIIIFLEYISNIYISYGVFSFSTISNNSQTSIWFL